MHCTAITKQFQLHLGYILVKPTVPIKSDSGEARPGKDMYNLSAGPKFLFKSFTINSCDQVFENSVHPEFSRWQNMRQLVTSKKCVSAKQFRPIHDYQTAK